MTFVYLYFPGSFRIYVINEKVNELATLCLLWQHWTKAVVRFDDVDISGFHNCVVVDLWQSLCEWRLLLYACDWVCRREIVGF